MEREPKLAVVGIGNWGKNVLRSFAGRRNCSLKYMCDINPSVLQNYQRLYPTAIATTSFSTVLSDSEVDAVALSTPAEDHFVMAHAALKAGKHVYVEKPMALSVSDAEQLVACAEEHNLKLMVGHLLEYHPAVEFMKEQIDSGALGEIYYMYSHRLNLGVVRQAENAFWCLAPHDISVAMYLFGMEPDSITANGQCYLQADIEDVVFANLHFPNGRIANIHVSWLDPSKERKMVVVGSKKMLVFDDMQAAEKIRIYDKGANISSSGVSSMAAISVRHGDIQIPYISVAEPLDLETQHFVDCLVNNVRPRSDGHDGLRVVRVLAEVDRQLHCSRT